MVLTTNNATDRWKNLSSQRETTTDLDQKCVVCGGVHMTADHWKFMAEEMPSDPVEMIDDLIKMRVYKSDTLEMADAVNAADLRKTLLLKMAGKGD